MKLTSIDYAQLLQFVAEKFHATLLNKTQINKILFIVYGVYYAHTDKLLFEDDTPKAWPFGPVFPRVYKKIDISEPVLGFSDEKISEFKKEDRLLGFIMRIIDKLYDCSAMSLTRWSHEEGSPWYNTIYETDANGDVVNQNSWNTPISASEIKTYFKDPSNYFNVAY